MQYRVLVVDDEYQIREGSASYLRNTFPGDLFDTASNGTQALEIIRETHYDVMLLDVKMRGMDGLAVLRECNRIERLPVTAIISGFSDFEFAKQALELNARKYLVKPFTPDELTETVRYLYGCVEEKRSAADVKKADSLGLVEKARAIIEREYAEDISVRSLAENLNVNQDHLGKMFKKEYGISISEYIQNTRIQKAIYLFTTTDLNVGEVAEKCGFHDQTYSSTIFKKVTGKSPSRFRETPLP